VATKHVHIIAGRSSEVSIDIDPVDVQNWIESGITNKFGESTVGLYVQALSDDYDLVAYPDESNPNSQIFLELETYDYRSGRNRRSSQNSCRVEANRTNCCLFDLVIDFEKVGWEFVIAPKRYNANICNGECDPLQVGITH